MNTMTDADVAVIASNRCPSCMNWGFIAGPRGGAGQNIFCCNPECRAAYMVAPRHNIVMAQFVGRAPEQFYPPKVHILAGGQPLCSFSGLRFIDNGPPPRWEFVVPAEWPVGHSWVGSEDFESCTCAACRGRARS